MIETWYNFLNLNDQSHWSFSIFFKTKYVFDIVILRKLKIGTLSVIVVLIFQRDTMIVICNLHHLSSKISSKWLSYFFNNYENVFIGVNNISNVLSKKKHFK